MAAAPESESPLKFPMSFPIKIMGRRADRYAQALLDIVLQCAPDFDPSTLEMRASRGGNYLSVTVTINATSREQLDDFFDAWLFSPALPALPSPRETDAAVQATPVAG